jgi:hypothetical protein
MLPMAQLFFRQQYKGGHNQAATSISSKRWVKTEEQPVCYGDEEDAQSVNRWSA